MSESDFVSSVNNRFPGLQRMVLSVLDEPYRYLYFFSEGDIRDIEDQYPDVIEYLEFSDPDPDIVMGPTRRLLQAMTDLLQFIASTEYDIEVVLISLDD